MIRIVRLHDGGMRTSYGVVWAERGSAGLPGKLELLSRAVRFEGRNETHEIPYAEIESVRVGRSNGDRVQGRPSVILERVGGERVAIAAVAQSHVIGEIVERLTELTLQPPDEDVWYLPTPGPGDSDGGDVF